MNDGLLIEQLVRSFLVSKIDSICFYGQFWTGSKKGNIGLFEVDCKVDSFLKLKNLKVIHQV